MPTAKVTKNVSAAIGGGNVLCSTLISIKTKAWLYSFRPCIILSNNALRTFAAPNDSTRKARGAHHEDPLSRSYRVNLPSSLTMNLSTP